MPKGPEKFNFANKEDKKEFEKIPKGEQEIAKEIFIEEHESMSKGPEQPKYTPEQIAEIEAERAKTTAKMLKGGAKFEITEEGKAELAPTQKQIETVKKEKEIEIAEKEREIEEIEREKELEKEIEQMREWEREGVVAHNLKEINKNSKAYVGALEPGIFTKLQKYDIEIIYTKPPPRDPPRILP